MAWSSCCCTPGRSILARLAASPLMSPASPSTSTATSACFAAATASANPADTVSVMPQPFAYTTLTLPARALIPSTGVTASRGSPRPGQEPRVVLEQHDRLFGHTPRQLAVLGGEQGRPLALRCSAVVGIVEQPEGRLG